MDKKTIQELSALCRIKCTEEEEARFLKDLEGILAYFELLKEVDTEGVKPLNNILENIVSQNVFREDEVKPSLPREKFLQNAPSHTGGMIRVPPVMKG